VKKLEEKKQKISMKKNRRKERTKKTNRSTDSKRKEERETHNTKQIIELRQSSWPHPSSLECTALPP
jgi:hypothetical protein